MKIKSIISLIKTNKLYTFPTFCLTLVSFVISIYASKQQQQCLETELQYEPIISIFSDHDIYEFIKIHKFGNSKNDYTDFIKQISKEYFAKISSIEKIAVVKIGNIEVSKVKIDMLFWHDCFIFDFLDKLQKYSPGFINILSIDINKFTKHVGIKPSLKLEVICKIFQKL